MQTMHAAIYEYTGAAREVLKIVELPIPVPAPGEVRVKLAWSGVNPSDVKSRGGRRTRSLPFPRIIPHSDGAGVIDQVGPGVSEQRIGERVWIWNAAWGRPDGTAAEYIVLPGAQAVTLPASVDLAVGACLGIPALTAYRAVTMEGGVANQTVLVPGGAGAVGHYAIQFARLKGASQVIATVSGPEKASLARAAGADLVVNYRSDDVREAVKSATQGRGVDRIIEVDLDANLSLNLDLLRTDGIVVVYGSGAPETAVPFGPAILKGIRLAFFIVYNLAEDVRAQAIDDLNRLLTEDRLAHNIAVRLPLADVAGAHELVEEGRANGKVLLEI